MVTLPQYDFYPAMMRRRSGLRKPMGGAVREACRSLATGFYSIAAESRCIFELMLLQDFSADQLTMRLRRTV